ncbi:hypothetical protein [Agromyces seonyuensis]|uniref:DUF7882 family protein n=1 Tax=Agromyces seonyuensis TaxID=2662446 RepID=UPI001921A8A4|nr:hypothetical protein [Agromyces seonyuensis]
MGRLCYGTLDEPIEIPDWTLAHIKVVATTKLRRGETFMLTGIDRSAERRTSLWMNPAMPLRFTFDTVELETLDRELLQSLARAADSNAGLVVDLDEPNAAMPATPTAPARPVAPIRAAKSRAKVAA